MWWITGAVITMVDRSAVAVVHSIVIIMHVNVNDHEQFIRLTTVTTQLITPTNNNQQQLNNQSSFVLDSNERLLRLNVGGYPCDVVRNSLPLWETMSTTSNNYAINNNRDILRRLRIEADYYGSHQLVHDIDLVTIGEKVVFEANMGWARVAGGCRLPPPRLNDIRC